jgi:hypothetical protein
MARCSLVVLDEPALWHLDAARVPFIPSLDHLIGLRKQRGWQLEAEDLRCS